MKQCLYQNADDCSAANPQSAECTTAYNNALKEAERTAPKYATREDCVAEFGEGQCQQAPVQLAWHQKTSAGPAIQREFLDAADGRLHDGTSDGRRRGICTAAAVLLENRPARLTVNIPTRPVKLWRSPAVPHHDRTEDGNGTKTDDHYYCYPWRFW